MTLRALRRWIVLGALVTIVTAALLPSVLADLLAGTGCVAGALALVALDGLGKRGGPRL